MCGVAISVLTADPAERVTRALDRMPHRGPDGRDISDFGQHALGTVRLAVRGNAAAAPRYRAWVDGDIVFNGEIYRHSVARSLPENPAEELDALLDARREGTEPDGMFALAMVDGATGDIVCTRDRLGIKPLFYQRAGGGFDLASEVAAIPRERRRELIDGNAIIDTLVSGRTSSERTHRSDIFELPPGGELRISPNGDASLSVAPFRSSAGLDDPERPLATILRESVAACCLTNGPIALAMSGGLDSVAIAFALDALGIENVQIFSVLIDGSEDGVRDLKTLGLPEGGVWRSWTLHRVEVDEASYAALMARAMQAIDAPHRMSSAALVVALAEAIQREGIKVVLTGEGPDELDFGYAGHVRLHAALERAADPAARADALFDHVCPPDLRRHLAGIVAPEQLSDSIRSILDALEPFAALGDGRAIQEVELRYSLAPLLHRSDHCFMAASVEARMPFLHGGYPEAARRAAEQQPLGALMGKRRLRDGLRHLLPRSYVEMPKRPFRAPIHTWLARDLGDRLTRDIRDGADAMAQFGIAGLDSARLAAMRGDAAGTALLFSLANLARWISWETRT